MPIVSYTAEEMRELAKKTDWEKIRNMSEEDIDYTDIPEVTEEDFASSKVRRISKDELMKRFEKVEVELPIDRAVLDFFKELGDDWKSRMNDALLHIVKTKKIIV